MRVVKQYAMSTCKIDGLDIIDHVKRVYATPALRDKISDQVYEDPGDGAPTQFNQTPFCKEPFKYMYLRTFFHRTAPDQEPTEFRVDDVVKLRDSTVMRIDKLSYRAPNWQNRRSVAVAKAGGDVFPVLVITGPVFRPVREVHVCHVETIVSYQAIEVVKKLAVGTRADNADIVCAGEVTASGRRRVFTTRQTPLTFPGGGGNFLWLAVYIDAMSTATKHAKSTECIYLQICSVDKSIYGTRDTIFTLKLLPKGADLDAALLSIREQLATLMAGIIVYDVKRQGNITLRCGVASLPADHLQAVVNCRGLHVNANIAGRACHLHKDRYADHTVDCREHGLRRRALQSDAIVASMEAELENLQLKKTPAKAMQTIYGTRPVPSIWRDVGCDPHVQSWVDAAHLIWFGVFPDICKAIVKKMDGVERDTLTVRLQQFPWPQGVSPPLLIAKEVVAGTSRKSTGVFGSGVTMDGWKLLAYASQSCFDGLCDKKHLQLLVDMTRTAARMFSPLTAEDCDELVAVVRDIIKRGWGQRGIMHEDQPTGKPNTHNLLELVLHTLPALRNAIWADCRPLESHHQVAKSTMAGRRGGRGGDSGEAAALLWYTRGLCVRLLVGGMVWHTAEGSMLEMHPDLRNVRDFREGREHLPHPIVSAMTNLTPKQHTLLIPDSGGWVPGVLGKKQAIASMDLSLRSHISAASLRDGVETVFAQDGTVLPWADCTDAYYCQCDTLVGEKDGRQPMVRVGDDIACTYDGKPAWFTLRRMLVVWARDEVRIWMWPDWWCRVIRNGRDTTHKQRGTALVERASAEWRESLWRA